MICMQQLKFVVLTALGFSNVNCYKFNSQKFPEGFLFGTATSAFQTEGAWNENGKGESIWDHYTHTHPELIIDKSNADIACDSYHKFKEDVRIIKDLGVNFYRFSISWSRILPKGLAHRINPDGIRYYNQLINSLVAENITPMVTMFHWDTPLPIEELGGFANSLVVEWFKDYANILFEHFGDRVKYWVTFNAPREVCAAGYGTGERAPGYNSSGVGDYMCAHNILKAHAKVYRLYNKVFKTKQKGKISIAVDVNWYEPGTASEEDIEAANRAMEFYTGWFTDPIYHPYYDYPVTMKSIIGKRSKAEGFLKSRLPQFSAEDKILIKGTSDYFAINHYTTSLVTNSPREITGVPSLIKDLAVDFYDDPNWNQSVASFIKVVPWGFRKALNWIKSRYGDIEIIVTENGYCDFDHMYDHERIDYLKAYLSALLDSIYEDKVKIVGYSVWSLLDNFEWTDGYKYKFGLYHVNFSDPERPRTPRFSAAFYKELIVKRRLNAGNNNFLHPLVLYFNFIMIYFLFS